MNNILNLSTAKAPFVVILLMMCVQSLAQSETSYQPLLFLEGNPIWVFKHEKISRLRDPNLTCWIDDGSRHFAYYFIGDTKEINGKDYTMMGVTGSRGEDITLTAGIQSVRRTALFTLLQTLCRELLNTIIMTIILCLICKREMNVSFTTSARRQVKLCIRKTKVLQ